MPADSRTGPLVGLGHPRCGTHFTASLLTSAGLQVGHERIRRDGMVSWMTVAERDAVPWGESYGDLGPRLRSSLFLVARSPVTAMRSILGED